MNGKTHHDEILNPCCAESDKATYGFRYLNFSTWGHRWLALTIGILHFDFYKQPQFWKFSYWRIRNAATLFCFFGSITWPMPDKLNIKEELRYATND